jgi:hypothetical protein
MPLSQHEDWTLFRSLGTLGQQAGVSQEDLAAVVAKELVDNALDASGACRVDLVPPNGVVVEDDGPGMPGDTPHDIAMLFSIARSLVSSKLTRLPTRGALGNGLRVVAGAVLAADGTLQVTTNGQVLRLIPQDDGGTRAVLVGQDTRAGTRVEVQLGPALPVNEEGLRWARNACLLAEGSQDASCKTSPHWYDADSFYELLQAAGTRPAREVIAEFDGCSGATAGRVCAFYLGRAASSLSRDEATVLLTMAQGTARTVSPSRLGRIGPHPGLPNGYASIEGTWLAPPARGSVAARIPYVVEVWAGEPSTRGRERKAWKYECNVLVNKTPVTARLGVLYDGADKTIALNGCGLFYANGDITVACRPSSLWINVQTPYMPVTTEGKAPDLLPLRDAIAAAIQKATGKAKRLRPIAQMGQRARSIKEITQEHIPAGVALAGTNGRYRFSQRQLFYKVRPFIIEETGEEPKWGTFTDNLTDYEEKHGRLAVAGLTRDPRGVVYHPHRDEEIPLGTLAIEEYERPPWTFNKVLYCEKEGFFSILRSEQWPERHDCALLTAKGHATRAAKDLIDHLGDTDGDEVVTFYCIHDADAAGTMIHQALQEATATRGARRARIVNLGLDPWEAMAMDLPVESVTYEKRQPVARYVEEYGQARDEDWADWLQTHRVELNAMTTEAFIAWLDGKMADRGGKVIPPADILMDRLRDETHDALTMRITARILADADLDGQVAAAEIALAENLVSVAMALPDTVTQALHTAPAAAWSAPIIEQVAELCASLEDDCERAKP